MTRTQCNRCSRKLVKGKHDADFILCPGCRRAMTPRKPKPYIIQESKVHMFNNDYYEKVKGSEFDFSSEYQRVRFSVAADGIKNKRKH